MTETRTSFTFRVVLEEVKELASQLKEITTQAQKLGKLLDKKQVFVDKKSRHLRALTKRLNEKEKILEKLQRKAEAQAKRLGKLRAATCSCEEVNTTFATEDLSLSEEIASPTGKKRKRFAGIWDDQDFSNMLEARVDKKARTESTLEGEEAKENIPATTCREIQCHPESVHA